jgi:acyl-homoserine lactone acylase PvdQ
VWDLGDLDRSACVSPSGASGNPGSPHWNDQSALYLQGRLRPSPVRPVVGDEALTIAPE